MLFFTQQTDNWAVQILWGAFRAVDTFFFIGGLLVAKSLLARPFCVPSRKEKLSQLKKVSAQDDNKGGNKQGEENTPTDVIEMTGSDEVITNDDDVKMVENQAVTSSYFLDEEAWQDFKALGFQKFVVNFCKSYAVYVFHRIIRCVL